MGYNNQKRITFGDQKDANSIIEKILENSGLKEDIYDYADKIDQGAQPYFDTLYKIIIDLTDGDVNETIFLSDIQKELNVSEKTARNILSEVKEKILPLVVIMSEEEIEKENNETPGLTQTPTQPIKQPVSPSKTSLPPKIKEKIPELNTTPVIPTRRVAKKTVKTEETKKDDRYREPIE